MVLSTSLTGGALDEFTSLSKHFMEEVHGFPEPTLARMLAELDQWLLSFPSQGAARADFKSLMQGDKEGLRDFSRRVRSLSDLANANMGVQMRDDMNPEQFIDGIFDEELQELLLPE